MDEHVKGCAELLNEFKISWDLITNPVTPLGTMVPLEAPDRGACLHCGAMVQLHELRIKTDRFEADGRRIYIHQDCIEPYQNENEEGSEGSMDNEKSSMDLDESVSGLVCIHLLVPPVHASIHPSIHPFIHPPTHPPIHPSIHPSIYPSIHPSVCTSIHLSMYVSTSINCLMHPQSHSTTYCVLHASPLTLGSTTEEVVAAEGLLNLQQLSPLQEELEELPGENVQACSPHLLPV
jgi:hypothetical protein